MLKIILPRFVLKSNRSMRPLEVEFQPIKTTSAWSVVSQDLDDYQREIKKL